MPDKKKQSLMATYAAMDSAEIERRLSSGQLTPRRRKLRAPNWQAGTTQSCAGFLDPGRPGIAFFKLTRLHDIKHTFKCYTYLCVDAKGQNMASTVNFTGSVDRDLLKRAKVIAAKSDTSINALFNAELRYLVETFEASEASGNQNFKVLLDFSLGRLADAEAMRALGIDSDEDLFLLMAQAHLPMPRLPDAATREMVEQLNALPTI
jgi:hypothetical protein